MEALPGDGWASAWAFVHADYENTIALGCGLDGVLLHAIVKVCTIGGVQSSAPPACASAEEAFEGRVANVPSGVCD